MARFAPVVLLHLAAQLKSVNCLGQYHLLLAHDVLENADAYMTMYGLGTEPGNFFIMDNSLIELGYPLPLDQCIKAAAIMQATYTVLPDYLGDMQKTIDASKRAIEDLTPEDWDIFDSNKLSSFMGVLQGKTLDELMHCASELLSLSEVTALSVPRVVVANLGTRRNILEQLDNYFPSIPIHLLGFSNDIVDDMVCSNARNVIGIDSAVPVRMGLKYQDIRTNTQDPGPRNDYWTDARAELTETKVRMIKQNLSAVRKWIEEPNVS